MIQRFYFDTSVISGVYDTGFAEQSTILMEKVKLGQVKAVISEITEREIMKAKEKKSVKKFDAVKEMRKIRDEISLDIADMNYEQMKAYFKQPRLLKSK